jgi:serine/threonine protein kinase
MDPERISRYELHAPLGQGGMGTVYKAYDSRIDRRIAVDLTLQALPPSGSRTNPIRVWVTGLSSYWSIFTRMTRPMVRSTFMIRRAGGCGGLHFEQQPRGAKVASLAAGQDLAGRSEPADELL